MLLPARPSAFLSDDWSVVAHAQALTLSNLETLYTSSWGGWYRPTFILFLFTVIRLLGDTPFVFHVVVIILYVFLSFLVGLCALLITKRESISSLSCLLFAVNAVHVEPVLWLAASNEILAAIFALSSIILYIMFITSNRIRWWLMAIAAYLFAVTTKKTALFVPIVFLVATVLFDRRAHKARALYLLLIALAIGLLFVILRARLGSPYDARAGLSQLHFNLLYYIATTMFGLPDNYGYRSSLDEWRHSPWLPIATMLLATTGIMMLAISIKDTHRDTENRILLRESSWLIFIIIWLVSSIMPVSLTATGRTALMFSIGVAWLLATMFVVSYDGPKRSRQLAILSITLIVVANITIISFRASAWRQAAIIMNTVLETLDQQLANSDPQRMFCVVDLPDHYQHAYIFRNAFPALSDFRYPRRNLTGLVTTLDNSTFDTAARCCFSCDNVTTLRYVDNVLIDATH